MNRKVLLRHGSSMLALGFLLLLALGSMDSSSPYVALNASVRFTGAQFVIQNKDSFDWTNVKLEVNSAYLLETIRIAAGETYTVGAMQFAKSDGEKFNPFTHKPLNFSIWCDTPKGKAFYYASWK